jgi:hypothetical protein
MDSKSYERVVEQHEEDRLTHYTQRATLEQEKEITDHLLVNMSITEIMTGVSQTIIEIINEVVSGEIKTLKQLAISLFKGERMIYIGVLTVMIAFAFYIMDLTG